MSLTFTKLFSSITESTVWMQPAHVRLVWITMLAMADRHGLVFGSIPGLANRARVSLEEAEEALQVFLSPDPYSRSKEHDGKRIAEVDGGWELLNYSKYRKIQDAEAVKDSKRRWAEKSRCASICPSTIDIGRESASASSSPSGVDQDQGSAEGVIVVNPRKGRVVPKDWQPNGGHRGRCQELGLDFEATLQGFREQEFNRDYSDWDLRFSKWITDERNKQSRERAEAAQRRTNGGPRSPAPTWEPNARHRAFCEKHCLDLKVLARRYIDSGLTDSRSRKDNDEGFGVRLAALARGENDPILGEAAA